MISNKTGYLSIDVKPHGKVYLSKQNHQNSTKQDVFMDV